MSEAGQPALRFYFWMRNGVAEYTWRAPGCQPDRAVDITDMSDDEFVSFVQEHATKEHT